ncbi:MAG: hypothetical protein KatS3mg091_496 [Patescibacteria group bacterium]|nr:MAG: hypothetical protein KatS3mg091_496 [Patescibacteria group bacterium]
MRKLKFVINWKSLFAAVIVLTIAGYIFFNIPPSSIFIILSFVFLLSLGLSLLIFSFLKKHLIKLMLVFLASFSVLFIAGLSWLNVLILLLFYLFIFFLL